MLKVCFAWIWLPQILLAAVFCQLCGAQTDPAIQLANQVRADVGSLASGRTWGTWQTGHPHEALKEFDYETSATPPSDESPFTRQQGKCGFSVGQLPGGVTRAASFYAPLVQAGKLRPLPEQVNRTLIQRCGLDELWYVAHSLVRMESVVVALESAWGKANGASEEMGFGSAQLWPGITAWHRDGWNVWIVPNPAYGNRGWLGSLAIFVRRSAMPDDSDLMVEPEEFQQKPKQIAEESASSLATIVSLGSSLSAGMVSGASCAKDAVTDVDYSVSADRLGKWMGAAKRLPPPRRAAALILADDYMTCLDNLPDESRQPFIALGAKFDGGCAEDGGEYGHTFRREAEKLDPDGRAGAWGQLADLWSYCAMEGGPAFVAIAEKLLRRFPEWRASLYYLIGRAHETRLAFAYPGGFPDDGAELAALSASLKQKERLAAIQAYRNLVQEKPGDSEAVFAWREAWRLLAGLKPPAVEFGCTCE